MLVTRTTGYSGHRTREKTESNVKIIKKQFNKGSLKSALKLMITLNLDDLRLAQEHGKEHPGQYGTTKVKLFYYGKH